MDASPEPPEHERETLVMALFHRGLTYAAIARRLADRGVTYAMARWIPYRLGHRRPAGRPRASAPDLIPSRSRPPSRW